MEFDFSSMAPSQCYKLLVSVVVAAVGLWFVARSLRAAAIK